MIGQTRVVMAADFSYGTTGSGVAHGLRALGIDLEPVDSGRHAFLPRGFLLRAAGRASEALRRHAYNAAIIDAVETVKPHAFLTVKGTWLEPQTLQRIGERGAARLNYYPDFHFGYRDVDTASFPFYDRFLTTKSFQVEDLKQRIGAEKVELLHHGYCDAVHFPRHSARGEDDYVADVTYVGNYTPHKEKWLSAIAQAAPDAKLRIAGAGWHKVSDEALRKGVLGHQLSGDFYARAVQSSRINVAVHMGPLEPGGWQDLVSIRTFEIPACRGFMLHVDNEDIRALFAVGEEIDVFANEEELAAKVAYYLSHSEKRREMTERAYARCVPAYGYDARAKVIAQRIEDCRGERGA